MERQTSDVYADHQVFRKTNFQPTKTKGKWTVPSVSEEFYLVSRASLTAEL